MPTYEYRCSECDHQFEVFQTISDPPVTICPECGGPTKRVISGGAGLIFKGTGFYITDYKKSGAERKADNGIAKPSSDNAKKETKSKPPSSAGS